MGGGGGGGDSCGGGDGGDLAALRLPDGASNPNICREPGNGASGSDTEEEAAAGVAGAATPEAAVAGAESALTLHKAPSEDVACCKDSSGYGSLPTDGYSSASTRLSDLELRATSRTGSSAEVLQYCREDVARLERRWTEVRAARVRQLRCEQARLCRELAAAKERLLLPPHRWRYELHVEASMDQRDPAFVEALERETDILRKRVDACKSRVMFVTCFDCVPRTPASDDSSSS